MSSDLDVMKNNVVTQMFVDTADQNYLIARWAYHRGMFIDFFWNSVHALEKYLKASLLLNGHSAIENRSGQNYGHNLECLFEEVGSYALDLFPKMLIKPHLLDVPQWREEKPTDFLARFNDLGNAHNRYNLFGYTQRLEDLHHLDQMVYFARRVAFNLDICPFIGRGPFSDTSPKTVRACLEGNLKYSPRSSASSRLHKLLDTKGDDELRDAGLKFNYQFAPDNYDHEQGGVGFRASGSNSVLYQRIVARANNMNPSSADIEAADLASWVIDNIYLPTPVKDEMQRYEKILRKRLP